MTIVYVDVTGHFASPVEGEMVAGAVRATLDPTGSFTISLAATNNPAMPQPAPVFYEVLELPDIPDTRELFGERADRRYFATVPYNVATIDIADLVPVGAPPPPVDPPPVDPPPVDPPPSSATIDGGPSAATFGGSALDGGVPSSVFTTSAADGGTA